MTDGGGSEAPDWEREFPPERLRRLAGSSSAEYLPVTTPVFYVGVPKGQPWEALHARTIISFGGICLVETMDCLDDWYMGQPAPDGSIHCWGRYGPLEDAIAGL